jgi:uncharacterized protein (DUF1800 family)
MAEISIALNRFGFGARGDSQVGNDARRWLKAQLSAYQPKPTILASLPTRGEIAEQLADNLEMVRAAARTRNPAGDAADPKRLMRRQTRQDARGQHVSQVGARIRIAAMSETPFIERLVHFWANHFAVSAEKLTTVGFAGMLEFEAIRPHVLGRFADMLIAVEQHPAMLLYLDQAQSIGPSSQFGSRVAVRGNRAAGLNENLAREILELHTLGVRTGYTQADVTEFARAMTGWTVAGLGRGPVARALAANASPGAFVFVPQIHEPGDRTIVGRRYPAAGEAQAMAVLNDLARHPATAKHIATKLARHFIADDPPPAVVARLESVFLKSDGDLPELYEALIDAREAWNPISTKFKTPWDWSISAFRALGVPDQPDQALTGMLAELGQPVWRPGSPAGFDDVAVRWAGPDALMKRVEVAQRLAARNTVDVRMLGQRLFGESLSGDTQTTIARARDGKEALALLLVSPEFMRR